MAGFDIGSLLSQVAGKASDDNDFLYELQDSPAKAIENLTGVNLPDEQIDAIVKQMGGLDSIISIYQSEGTDGLLKKLAGAEAGSVVADLLGGKTETPSTETKKESEGDNIAGELLEGILGGNDKKSSSKKSKDSGSENIAGEILGDILGSK